MNTKGQATSQNQSSSHEVRARIDSFVLDKSIFSNIFEKDIRRVFIYKKAERLAKAIQLIAPAFRDTPALRQRTDQIAIALVDAAILPPTNSRDALSRELLALSSVLSMARSGGLLSSMNAELIAGEAHQLLQEVAQYVEPRLFLDDAPSLAVLAKDMAVLQKRSASVEPVASLKLAIPKAPILPDALPEAGVKPPGNSKGHGKGHTEAGTLAAPAKKSNRREAILSVLGTKSPVYIKDVSSILREVSEKTIQRELQSMVEEGILSKTGERRWTTYALA